MTTARRFGQVCAAGVLAFVVAVAAHALEPPGGPVLLTLTGALQTTNRPGAAAFDMALLASLPQHSFTTATPWYPQPRKFTGVRLRDLLAAVGAAAAAGVKAVALNDYRADIPGADIARTDVMLAYLLDDQPMPVRDKGPLMIIYPFDSQPELRTALHYSRAVWQLHRLEVR